MFFEFPDVVVHFLFVECFHSQIVDSERTGRPLSVPFVATRRGHFDVVLIAESFRFDDDTSTIDPVLFGDVFVEE